MSAQDQGKRSRSGLVLLVIAIVLALAGGGALAYSLLPKPGAIYDMAGNVVQPEVEVVELAPGEAGTEAAPSQRPDIGLRFQVPSVDLDVPLGASEAVNGAINPPGFQSVYWITNLGVGLDSAADGTVYLATHSLRGGGIAPGNYLMDADLQQAKVHQGDKIYLSNLVYTVVETRIIPKREVADASGLWEPVPGRLIVLTCLQNPQNQPSRHNVVITASLDK